MANIMDYLEWRGDLTFSQSPFNEVDNLIFSQIIYTDFKDIIKSDLYNKEITLKEAAEIFFKNHKKEEFANKLLFIKNSISLFKKASETNRFSNVKIRNYENKINYDEESQFSAITFEIDEQTDYICFRGTDDTIIGWKEDFNMSFTMPVPAQEEALEYLKRTASENKFLVLGGHSKGGNLAVYAAVKAPDEFKDRIIKVYNNDGPGFSRKMTKNKNYKDISPLIETFVPEASVVGILFEHEEEYKVVKSKNIGITQHNAFSWKVMGAKFICLDEIPEKSKRMDETLKLWLGSLNKKQREDFVEAVFAILENSDAKTLEELIEDKWLLIKSIKNMDENMKKIFSETILKLLDENKKNFKKNIIKKLPIKLTKE